MTQTNKRIQIIDLCRGILILMMTARHTITNLSISREHWLFKYFLPSGWATVCFISLSGFSIGMLYLERMRDPEEKTQLAKRLRKRSGQLLAVMFISNIFFLISENIVKGEVNTLLNPSWWLGLITLKTPYSISSILIPTALLVYIAPIVSEAILRYRPFAVLCVLICISIALAVITSNINNPNSRHYILRRLLFGGDGFFPIIPLLLYGTVSICVGSLWRLYSIKIILTSSVLYYSFIFLKSVYPSLGIVSAAISGPARLVIILLYCSVLLKVSFLSTATHYLITIGRYSLFSFLLHRIILHALILLAPKIHGLVPVEFLFFLFFSLNMAGIWLVCLYRIKFPRWNSLLRSFYL